MQVRPAFLIAVLAISLTACSEENGGGQGYTRVAAVKASRPELQPSSWCDVYHAPGQGPAFEWPSVLPENALGHGRMTWLNLWATWCQPCLREMPLVGRFRDGLAAEGQAVDLVFLSVDEEPAQLVTFLQANPQTIPARSRQLRLKNPSQGTSWLTRYGLKQEATIPIHVLLDAHGRLRCIRAGSLHDGHYRTVRAVLGMR